MKFPIINPSKDESVWGAWCYQWLYHPKFQPSKEDFDKAVESLVISSTWKGMNRGANSDVEEASLRTALEKSLQCINKTLDEVVGVRLTSASVIVDFDDIFLSFYVRPSDNSQLKPF